MGHPQETLARNLILLKELERFLDLFSGGPVLLLKGAGLLCCGCADARSRPMQDLDILIPPRDLDQALKSLEGLGFSKRPGAAAFLKGAAAFDIHTRVWYLTPEEEADFRRDAGPVPVGEARAWTPAPQDHLIYILAHAAVHHGEIEPKWARDVRDLLKHHAGTLSPRAVEGRLRSLGLWPAAQWFLRRAGLESVWPLAREEGRERRMNGRLDRLDPFLKGHLLRFWFLRGWRFRLRYAAAAFFPETAFLRLRYDIRLSAALPVFRLLRPFLILSKAAAALGRLVLSLLSAPQPLPSLSKNRN